MQSLLLGTQQSLNRLSSKYGVNAGILGQWIPLLQCYFDTCNCNVYSAMTHGFTHENTTTHAQYEKKSSNFPLESTPTPSCLYNLLWKAILQPVIPFSTLCPLKYTQKIIRKSTICFWTGHQDGWPEKSQESPLQALHSLISVPILHSWRYRILWPSENSSLWKKL